MIISRLFRKFRRLADDTTLRRWLVARAFRQVPPPEPTYRRSPPYLRLPDYEVASTPSFSASPDGKPTGELTVLLAGRHFTVQAETVAALFDITPDDGEILSALHRFAWIRQTDALCDPRWVTQFWSAWKQRFSTPDEGPAWEAYTAAERLINLLDFGRTHGLPAPVSDTLDLLRDHGKAIIERLEYYGETGTCNHLANNGRGLYRLGLETGMPDVARTGLDILMAEADRLFLPSGLLREASTHYHLLYVRNYADAWLAACRHQRPEQGQLESLLRKIWSVVGVLNLPGGLPLMGDISPDSPPDFLSGLLPGRSLDQGWTGSLPIDQRHALERVRDHLPSPAQTISDGWLRADFGPWSGLWHAEPQGWLPPTGHGHQDLGAPEIHLAGQPLFIDPGRGAYGDSGEAARYVSAAVHGGLQVDQADPFPVNKPYYTSDFRNRIGTTPPILSLLPDGVLLGHGGFRRLSGRAEIHRHWHFNKSEMRLNDHVTGRGQHLISRRLITLWQARLDDDDVIIQCGTNLVRISADQPLHLQEITLWREYGVAVSGWCIFTETPAQLPWSGFLKVEVMA